MQFIKPSESENKILNRLDDSYLKISEMTEGEREFLNALILRIKPKKVLEAGVSAGGSSIIILNACQEFESSRLYSIDYSKKLYNNPRFESGYFVDNYPNLKQKWTLYTGSLAASFMEEIGGGIDFCFIDTMHINPGEILDFLMIAPYLKDEAVICFHDVAAHTSMPGSLFYSDKFFTNNILLSAIAGGAAGRGDSGEAEDDSVKSAPHFGASAALPTSKISAANTAPEIFEVAPPPPKTKAGRGFADGGFQSPVAQIPQRLSAFCKYSGGKTRQKF